MELITLMATRKNIAGNYTLNKLKIRFDNKKKVEEKKKLVAPDSPFRKYAF